MRDGRTILLRPIRPEDEALQQALMSRMSHEDIYFRFFRHMRKFGHLEMARLTQIDYHREMAFIAVAAGPNGSPESLGVVRTVTDTDNNSAEFSVLVRSDLKGQGLGTLLMQKMIRYCRERGTMKMVGRVLVANADMLRLVKKLSFAIRRASDDEIVDVSLSLNESR